MHPSSDTAPSPLCSKAVEGKEYTVPCAPIAPCTVMGDRLCAYSQLFQEPRVAGQATYMCMHGLCALSLPCWETQERSGCCSPGHMALLDVRPNMAGQLEGAEPQSPRTQAPHRGGLRCESLSTELWALGAGHCSPSTVSSPASSHTTAREDMAEGDPQVCHTHPAEINFNEWLNVCGFGLEIKAHRVTGGF